jgi:hypothetical protein
MADEPEIRMLRTMDIKLDRVLREVQALKAHSVAIEDGLVALRKDIQNLDERVARTETRLDLRDEPTM